MVSCGVGVSELKAWKTVQRGKHTNGDASYKALDVADYLIGRPNTDDIFRRGTFAAGTDEVDLVVVSNADLGYSDGATHRQTYERAVQLGLEKVPHWGGPVLREEYKDQPRGELLRMGMEPIRVANGDLYIFELGCDTRVGLWLSVEDGHPDGFLDGSNLLVFVLPRA